MFKDMFYCSFYGAVSTAYCVLYNRTLDVKMMQRGRKEKQSLFRSEDSGILSLPD
jgi:hypothetical protein